MSLGLRNEALYSFSAHCVVWEPERGLRRYCLIESYPALSIHTRHTHTMVKEFGSRQTNRSIKDTIFAIL